MSWMPYAHTAIQIAFIAMAIFWYLEMRRTEKKIGERIYGHAANELKAAHFRQGIMALACWLAWLME